MGKFSKFSGCSVIMYGIHFSCSLYRVGQKKVHNKLVPLITSNVNRFSKLFVGRFFRKFAVKWLLWIQPHIAYVARLPCKVSGAINCHV